MLQFISVESVTTPHLVPCFVGSLDIKLQLQCVVACGASLQSAVAETLLIKHCHSHQGAARLSSSNPAACFRPQAILFCVKSSVDSGQHGARRYLVWALVDVLQAKCECVCPLLHDCAWYGLSLNLNCLYGLVSSASTGKHQGGCSLNSRRALRTSATQRQAVSNMPDTLAQASSCKTA